MYKCKHCYGSFPNPGELPLEKVYEIISESHGLFDCLIFSGGEPFLHPDLAEMVKTASKDFVVFITTSGFPVPEYQTERIKNSALGIRYSVGSAFRYRSAVSS